MSKIVYLESTAKHKYIDDLKFKLEKSLQYFPELQNNTVYIGIVKIRINTIGYANVDNNMIAFKWDIEPKYITIFHELMHLIQFDNNDLPKTEEWNSIYAVSRMPIELVDDNIPYVCHEEIPFCLLADCCRESVKYREAGNRNYIQFLRKKIDRIYKHNRQKEYLENMKMLPIQIKLQVINQDNNTRG